VKVELEVISAIPAERFTPQGRARLEPDIKSLMLRLRKRQGKLRRLLPIFFFFVIYYTPAEAACGGRKRDGFQNSERRARGDEMSSLAVSGE
jgi:hypothetical protein